jgi:hypothetical protein
MPEPSRYVPLSLPRRWMRELLFFTPGPYVTGGSSVLRLADVVAARRKHQPLIGWNAILLKGIALTAQRYPELKRCYMAVPSAHFYQHPHCVASIVVERDWEGERAPFFDQIDAPEHRPLRELDGMLRALKTLPLETVSGFRRLIRYARLPQPLRRLMFRLGYQFSGELRSRFFGTFLLNSISSRHGHTTQAVTPMATTFFYGPVEPNGHMTIQIFFDHRVMDGAAAGRLLVELNGVLCKDIVAELNALD